MLKHRLSTLARKLKKSAIQQALEKSIDDDLISFSLGMPDTSILPLDKYKTAFQSLYSPSILQYSAPLFSLKIHIANLMKERQIKCKPEQILLTSGAQQAITLICNLLVDKGDSIIVEEISYPGFIQIAKSVHANLIPAPVDYNGGIVAEQLKKLLMKIKTPKLLYTIPEGHNPLGVSLSHEKRLEIVNIANSWQLPIIEDDAYGFINYDKVNPTLYSYSTGLVFYIGSFSKILSPTTRLGWIVAPEPLIEKLEVLKEGIDINTSTLSQHIVNNYLNQCCINEHILFVKNHYRKKRDVMVEAIKNHIPEMDFYIPHSGFFIWGRLPPDIDTNNLFLQAIENNKVSFLPGASFGVKPNSSLSSCLRLSFALCDINMIEPGIKRLKQALKEYRT
jgi:2-aminoadipate transaminase